MYLLIIDCECGAGIGISGEDEDDALSEVESIGWTKIQKLPNGNYSGVCAVCDVRDIEREFKFVQQQCD